MVDWLVGYVVVYCFDVLYVFDLFDGGVLLFMLCECVLYYYGVGVYLCLFDDVCCVDVCFVSECFVFVNVLCDVMFVEFGWLGVYELCWKVVVLCDFGMLWDFEDICDYYLQMLYDVVLDWLWCEDLVCYFELLCVVIVDVMCEIFFEW